MCIRRDIPINRVDHTYITGEHTHVYIKYHASMKNNRCWKAFFFYLKFSTTRLKSPTKQVF